MAPRSTLDRIARHYLNLKSLEPSRRRQDNWHELHVSAIRDALEEAYNEGLKEAGTVNILPAVDAPEIRPATTTEMAEIVNALIRVNLKMMAVLEIAYPLLEATAHTGTPADGTRRDACRLIREAVEAASEIIQTVAP